MKFTLLISTVFLSCIMFSCKKKGCTDLYAINYSADANEDDGSCKAAEYLIIKSVEVTVNKSTDDDGIEWDPQGLPDCFVDIRVNSDNIQTEVVNDAPIGKPILFNLEPNIVIKLDTLHALNFITYDKDGLSKYGMAGAYVIFVDNTHYGSADYDLFDFHKRFALTNDHSFGGNNNYNRHVSMIVNLEWE